MPAKGRLIAYAGVAFVSVVVALSLFLSRPPPRGKPPNLLLIVVDTLRADRLGAYGSARGLTPFLDSLAARGTVFRNAYAQSSWTSPSVASLFTSRYPSEHGVTARPDKMPVPSDDEVTLAESLRDHGYATAAFLAHFGLRGWSKDRHELRERTSPVGFGQGFEAYRVRIGHRRENEGLSYYPRASEINAQAVAWLKRALAREARPIFLYLHYMEPHSPYDPPASILAHLLAGNEPPDLARVNAYTMLWRLMPADEEMRAAVRLLYDAAVMSADQGIAQLFDDLDDTGFLDDAFVVITADHGEELHEHDIFGHGNTLYEALVHVPLLVLSTSGGKRQREVSDVVSLIDVAPTLLDRAGIARPESFHGTSLLPYLRDQSSFVRWLAAVVGPRRPPPAVSELIHADDWPRKSRHRYAVISPPHKLISGVDGTLEIYDLVADPRERNPAPAGNGSAPLQRALARFRDQLGRMAAGVEVVDEEEIDVDTRERLRALGYAQ